VVLVERRGEKEHERLLNELGEQGWELVAVMKDVTCVIYYFKRAGSERQPPDEQRR
jgi:hypothetical protein